MRQTVLILSGLPGSGKTTSAAFFQKKGIPVVRIGALTDEYLKRKHLPIIEKNESKVRVELREKYGEDIYARRATGQTALQLKKHGIVVIEGMRSPAEYDIFKKNFPDIYVIFIEADKYIRFRRLKDRRIRNLTLGQLGKRDNYEIKKLRCDKLKKQAEFFVLNNGSKKDLFINLNKILQTISNDTTEN